MSGLFLTSTRHEYSQLCVETAPLDFHDNVFLTDEDVAEVLSTTRRRILGWLELHGLLTGTLVDPRPDDLALRVRPPPPRAAGRPPLRTRSLALSTSDLNKPWV